MNNPNRLLLVALVLSLTASTSCDRSTKVRIGVIPKAVAHVFWQTVHAGAIAAGQELDVEIEWKGPPAETDYSRQIEIVDAMINSRVDGIVLAPTEATSLVGVVERAAREGIPLTIFDSGINTEEYVSFVSTNNYEAGVLAAHTLAKMLDQKGRIIIVKMTPGASSTMQREAGFEATVGKEYPDIKIVDFKYCRSDRALALSVSENMLTANPNLDGMFASAEPATIGAAKALRSRMMHERIKLVGFDSTVTIEKDVRDGITRAVVVQDPFQIGYQAVKTVASAIRGENPPKRIDTATQVVSLENIDAPEIDALLHPDLEQYLN